MKFRIAAHPHRIASIFLSMAFAFVLVLTPNVALSAPHAESVKNEQETAKTLYAELSTLVKEFYPRAKVTVNGNTMHFEYKCHGQIGTQSHVAELAPGIDGVLGDIEVKQGAYKGKESLPKRVNLITYEAILLAPYSHSHDTHIMARLAFDPNAAPEFLEQFKDLVNKAAAHSDAAVKAPDTNKVAATPSSAAAVTHEKPAEKAPETLPQTSKVEAKPEAKAEAKPETKPAIKPETKAEAKPETKAPSMVSIEDDVKAKLTAAERSKDEPAQVVALLSLGDLMRTQGNLQSAEEYYGKALDLVREKTDRKFEHAKVMSRFAILHSARGKTQEADTHFKEAFKLAKEAGKNQLDPDVTEMLTEYAKFLYKSSRFAEANKIYTMLKN